VPAQVDPLASLVLLSLPRSLSTFAYHAARQALQLSGPTWVTDGEVLNLDRHLLTVREQPGCAKYNRQRSCRPAQWSALHDFLTDVTRPTGRCYKDVVQPFLMVDWLRERPQYRVLVIVPDVAHVAASMTRMRWIYPANAADGGDSRLERIVRGLLRANHALATVTAERVAYADLTSSTTALRDALKRLYPERPVPALNEHTPAFARYRETVKAADAGPVYAQAAAFVETLAGKQSFVGGGV
jgi:hypothetical protein